VAKELSEKVKEYEDNKEAIENLENLVAQRGATEYEMSEASRKMTKCELKSSKLNRAVGSLEHKVVNAIAQRDEYLDLQQQFSAYDLYMRCMHPNGIAYDVIKRKLPVINESISKVLANLTSFEVMFEEDGNRLNINIKHPAFDPRPLEMASGSEKTMAAMAIRLALLSVSSLPTSDIMILDEPGTALDEEHLQSFTELLDMIKGYFKTVLLISHLDSLKDVVDMTIDISKVDGCAFVNQ
jgi:exonuclease SbcC